MNLGVLQSIVPVIEQAEHVKINDSKLENFCVNLNGLEHQFKLPFTPLSLNPEDKMQLDFAYNAVNFCYWGDPKWNINYQGKEIGGAYGMKAAFNRALEDGFPLLDASFLENMDARNLIQIVRGNVHVPPLFDERLYFLHEVGSTLKKRYDGKVKNIIEKGEGDSIKLLKEITSNFACYDDDARYKGNIVLFHKRAQLFVHNVHKTLQTQGRGLSRVEELSALADYKIPQLLRNRGIFEYNSKLSRRIDNYKIIPAGSPEEIEIRAFTIEAVEHMVKQLKPRFPSLTAIELDHFLYFESKKKSDGDKPHHRSLTTAY